MPTSAADPLLDVSRPACRLRQDRCAARCRSYHVDRSEIIALLGPKGGRQDDAAARGLRPRCHRTAGTVTFSGRNCAAPARATAVRAGLTHVIEGHRILSNSPSPTTSCLPPMICRAASARRAWTRRSCLFPEIAAMRHDRGGALSGGQQQMLAVRAGPGAPPRLLTLDEPFAGLSPLLLDRVLSIAARLRETGVLCAAR